MLIFDCETAALPLSELHLEPFDEAEVKLGNIKDPAKAAEKVAEARRRHEAKQIDEAALNALTGRVLAIGMIRDGEFSVIADKPEQEMLEQFWKLTYDNRGQLDRLVGFNITKFDLPFLVRRSWKYGVRLPLGLRYRRYWGEEVIDLREIWEFGDRYALGSLDAVARHLGMEGKIGDGKHFAALWESDRAAALAYLERDCRIVEKMYKVMV